MDSTALTKGIRGTTGYLNLSRRTKGTQPDVHTPLRSKKVRRIHEEASSSLGAMVINVKSWKLVLSPATPSPVSGQRTAQAYPARATYSINHVKFMVLLKGRPSTPIENAESSKQRGRSCAENKEGRSSTTATSKDPPGHKSTADLPRSHQPSGQHQPQQFNCTTYRPSSPGAPSHISPRGHETINNIF